MLIKFTFKNWASFRDETTFTMIASDDERHAGRLSMPKGTCLRLLPMTAIYGGNASGKTNFFEALSFARDLVLSRRSSKKDIPVFPFALDTKLETRASSFAFSILANESRFEFGFELNAARVISEKLEEVTDEGRRLLYSRGGRTGKLELGKDSTLEDETVKQVLKIVHDLIPDNQLFLSHVTNMGFDGFRPVFDWFESTLELIGPDNNVSTLHEPLVASASLPDEVSRMISHLDTGISSIKFEEIDGSDQVWPKSYLSFMTANLASEDVCVLFPWASDDGGGLRHAVVRKKELVCYKWEPYHRRMDGTEAKFDFSRESAGTARLIELLPLVLPVFSRKTRKVYVIDEIDRSLHTNLSKKLIETFLRVCRPENLSQLIFTTHDSALMRPYLFRRDEIWLTERQEDGASQLLSIHDFKEIDKEDIRTRYLSGRYGGVPKFFLSSADAFHAGDEDDEAQESRQASPSTRRQAERRDKGYKTGFPSGLRGKED